MLRNGRDLLLEYRDRGYVSSVCLFTTSFHALTYKPVVYAPNWSRILIQTADVCIFL